MAGAAATIERVDLTGAVIESVDTPEMHHAFAELPDGTLAWPALNDLLTNEELVLRPPGGDTTVLWSCREFLDAAGPDATGACGSNTLSYDAERNSLLYSSFSLETVVELDATTGETLRYFGHVGPEAWDFEPAESAFWWQHGPHYTSRGTLLVSSKDVDDGGETVLREYALDEEAEALVEIFSFGAGEGVYADTMGEADLTPAGHYLHNYGSQPRLREIDTEGVVVWDVSWTGNFVGRSTPIEDLYSLAH